MRETGNGELLVEINDIAEYAVVVRVEIEKSLRPGGFAKTLEQRNLMELRDLDDITTSEEITETFIRDYNMLAEEIKVLNIRKTYSGSQAAIILILKEVAISLLKKECVRVGLVYSRARESHRLTRCFRCFATGRI